MQIIDVRGDGLADLPLNFSLFPIVANQKIPLGASAIEQFNLNLVA